MYAGRFPAYAGRFQTYAGKFRLYAGRVCDVRGGEDYSAVDFMILARGRAIVVGLGG